MTNEELKLLLSGPLWLFALMMLASLGNAVKQIWTARQRGSAVRCVDYVQHWPETLATVIANVLAFVFLVSVDQLNVASAIGVGYGLNSLADLIRPGGRSAAMVPDKTDQAGA